MMQQAVTKGDLAKVQSGLEKKIQTVQTTLEKKIQKIGTDLKKFATKADQRFATKDDLIGLAKAKDVWVLEERLDGLEEKINGLPTKDEFYTKMDEVMGELQTIREEQTVGSHQISDHEDRIENLENIHPQGQHPQAV